MDPDSPRARINQFFVSQKKRKAQSPASVSKRTEKDRTKGSPSAKGSLDSFLVTSQEGISPAKSQNPGYNYEANKVRVKRNLSLDAGKSPGSDNKDVSPAKSLNPGYNFESNIVKVKRNLTLETGISLRNDNKDARFLNQGRSQCPEASGVVCGIQPVLSSDVGIVTAGAQKGSLEFHTAQVPKFADFVNDFLSSHCSGISSSVSLTSDLKSAALKRHGSPPVLLQEERSPKRMHLGTMANKPDIQNELTSSSNAIKTSILNDSTHLDLKSSEKITGTRNTLASQAILRKCDSSSVTRTSACETPGTFTTRIGVGETPGSAHKSFSISPGESFWREAILVADGLIAPRDRLTYHGAEHSEALKLDYGTCNSNNRRKGECDDLLDKTPHAVRGTVCDVESASDVGAPSNHCNDLDKEASPLPVKQLDFCFDGKSCYEETSDATDAKPGMLTSKQNAPTQHPRLQNNDLMHEYHINKESSSFADAQRKPLKGVVSNKNRDSLYLDPGNTVSSDLDRGKTIISARYEVNGNCTPSSFSLVKDCLGLDNWLPPEICNVYKKKGISKLYPWQVDCLKVDGVLHNRNLVYSASTSAGKSFVAEILMLRRVISTGKIALLVLPYVSICTEKAEHLEVLLEPVNKHVRSYYGNQGGGALPKDTSIAVCTIEKANSLINRLLEEGRLSELGTIVIDELHMVGDQSRGYLLELLLTKLRYAAGEGSVGSSSGESSGMSSGKSDPARGLQIVGMSATLPNVASVADWLQAALYETDFRPVPLVEYIKVGSTIYNKNMEIIRTIPKHADISGKDPDHVVELCNEVVQEGHSVLIFCSSRKGCETTAKHIAKFLKRFSVSPRSDQSGSFDVSSAIDSLQRSPAGLDPILEETIPFGVAYHHAGLTVEERETVETCYRKGLVRVLTATSTLAAGVNLPARRVIFRQPRIGRDFLDGTRYKQMAGRAGRTGIDTKGESVLICKQDEVKRILSLLNDTCPPLHSCLSEDRNGMTHAILEVVAGGMVQTASDINRYVRCTLLNSTRPFEAVVKSAQDSLRWLCQNKFLEWNEETKLYTSTPLGRASFGSSLCPEESLIVLDDLRRAREGFVLASDLHLVYLVTPINVDVEPDWELYYERFMQLSSLDQSVGNRVGVQEPFLMRMAHGAPLRASHRSRANPKGFQGNNDQKVGVSSHGVLSEEQILRVCKRFYVALILAKLVQEIPVPEVCEGFKVARGMVQALQENAGRFASMVSVFCERLGWHDLESLVAKFQSRVSFGVRAEIVELTTIPYVKGSRARALYKAGLRTPQAIAEASIPEILKALFESSSWTDNATGQRKLQVGVAKKIKNGARKIVFEKAEEARVAAFSAFKSLGLNIPQFTCPVLPVALNSVPKKESSLSSGEESTSSFVGVTHLKHPLDASSSEERVEIARVSEIPEGKLADPFVLGSSVKKAAGSPLDDLIEEKSDKIEEGLNNRDYILNVAVNHNSETNTPSTLPLIDATGIENHSHNPVMEQQKCIGSRECMIEKGPRYAASVPGGLDSFLDMWDATPDFFFDIHYNKKSELNSAAPFEIHGIAIGWENSPIYYLDIPKDLLRHTGQGSNHVIDNKDVIPPNIQMELAKERWTRIGNVLGKKDVRKFAWNLKVQIQVLKLPAVSVHKLSSRHSGIKSLGLDLIDSMYFMFSPVRVKNAIDVSTIAWILSPDDERSSCPNLEKEVKKRLSSDAAAAANRSGRWKDQMRKAAYNGCCRRVAQTRALYSVMWKLLESEELVEPLMTIEVQLVNVLADMEIWGVGVDMEACLKARHIIGRKLKSLEKEAHRFAGKTFSLTMPADIANVLYEHLKLPMPGGVKGKHHPSTDKHCLDMLRNEHPIIPVIKEHRTLAKLLNSTLGSICALARLSIRTQRYTLHGHWLQTSTATGRLSMEEPNLQCVEHMVEFEMNDDDGKSGPGCYKINARDFLIPTQDEWFLLTADYSQIELRLMAHFSKDSSLIKLLSCQEADVFTMIAAKWTQKHESSVSSQERYQTKRLVYGILYGMGANTLADQLDCSSNEAAERIQSFKKSFPGVASWLQEAVATCRDKGYVETLKGRKRFLSKIKFGNNKEKSKAQRQAVNSMCQGSAADIIKIAMLFIYDVIGEDAAASFPCFLDAGKFQALKGRCRILLQVHDELVLEADASVVKEAGLLLQKCMENAVSLLVPLPVKLKVGRTWGALEPFKPNS